MRLTMYSLRSWCERLAGEIVADFTAEIKNWAYAAPVYGVDLSVADYCQWGIITCDNTNRIIVL
jgi:hypothetical protein